METFLIEKVEEEEKMSSTRASEIMSTYLIEVVGNGQTGLIDGFTSAEFLDHTQTDLKGPAALTAHVEAFRRNIKNLKVEVIGISAGEDAAFGIWRWEGIPIDPIWGKTAQGDFIVPRLIGSHFLFKKGILVEYQPFLDAMDMFGQLD